MKYSLFSVLVSFHYIKKCTWISEFFWHLWIILISFLKTFLRNLSYQTQGAAYLPVFTLFCAWKVNTLKPVRHTCKCEMLHAWLMIIYIFFFLSFLQVNNPFIVCMTYAFQTPDKLCFVLDLMNGRLLALKQLSFMYMTLSIKKVH